MQIFQSEITTLSCVRIGAAGINWYPQINAGETVLIACQEDVGTKFRVLLTDNGENWCPGSDAMLSVWYSGTGGEGNYTQINGHSALTIRENGVEVELITQMLSCQGAGMLWLILADGEGHRRTLCRLPYLVLPGPDVDSQVAEQYYTAFTEMIQAAQTFTTDPTLTVAGKPADAAAVGEKLGEMLPSMLLWSNPSPTGSFGEQTVSLDLSEVNFVVVACIYGTLILRKGQLGVWGFHDPTNVYTRAVTVTDNGIQFGVCYRNGNEIANDIMVPQYVFGLG